MATPPKGCADFTHIEMRELLRLSSLDTSSSAVALGAASGFGAHRQTKPYGPDRAARGAEQFTMPPSTPIKPVETTSSEWGWAVAGADLVADWKGVMEQHAFSLHKAQCAVAQDIVANAMPRIADGVRIALSADGGATTRQIVEIVRAQLALEMAFKFGDDFNSLEFNARLERRPP